MEMHKKRGQTIWNETVNLRDISLDGKAILTVFKCKGGQYFGLIWAGAV